MKQPNERTEQDDVVTAPTQGGTQCHLRRSGDITQVRRGKHIGRPWVQVDVERTQ